MKKYRIIRLVLFAVFATLISLTLKACGGGGGGGSTGGGGDTIPPSTPTDLAATAISSSQIDLSWTASMDNVGVAGYEIYRDGSYLKRVTATSASDTGLNPSTQYCYSVLAYDAAGNKSVKSGQVCTTTLTSQPSGNVWQKTYGGSDWDEAYSIQQTSDGGFIVAGMTTSFGAGWEDVYIIKLDSSGNKLWEKTYGGKGADKAYSIQQTSDGGYIVAGRTTSFGAGSWDFYVIKLDESGNKIWQKTYGGSDWDEAYSIQQTSDGGYIVAGMTQSFGAGWRDAYIIKLDSSGNKLWEMTYGGSDYDEARSIQQTSDGGYVVAGATYSFGGGPFWAAYILKLDGWGNKIWDKIYDGISSFWPYSIQQTSDGGYIVAGCLSYYDNDVYVMKLDSSGDITWERMYGVSTINELAFSIQQTNDGGFIVAGVTESFGSILGDFYVIKLNSSGNKLWEKTYGGSGYDEAYSIQQTSDGGFIVAGRTTSFGAGSWDFYVIKTDSNGNTGG